MAEEKILLAHGSGGKLSHDLIKQIFLPQFRNPFLEPLDDSAKITNQHGSIAFTTDSYVVKDLFRGNLGAALGVIGGDGFPRNGKATRVRLVGESARVSERTEDFTRVIFKSATRGI